MPNFVRPLSRAVTNLAETARFTGLETGQAELGIGEACFAPVPRQSPRPTANPLLERPIHLGIRRVLPGPPGIQARSHLQWPITDYR